MDSDESYHSESEFYYPNEEDKKRQSSASVFSIHNLEFRNKYKCYSRALVGPYWEKLCPLSRVRPSVCGLGPYSRPRAQFFPIRMSRPVNNIYGCFGLKLQQSPILSDFIVMQMRKVNREKSCCTSCDLPIAKRASDVMTQTRLGQDSDKTQRNKLEWLMILKISFRAKAGVPKTLLKRKLGLHSLYFPQNTLMLTEFCGAFSDLHSIFRLRALRYLHTWIHALFIPDANYIYNKN